jgi:hypothetical protein
LSDASTAGVLAAAEIEDNFAFQISIIATDILHREVGIVLVLPKQLAQ